MRRGRRERPLNGRMSRILCAVRRLERESSSSSSSVRTRIPWGIQGKCTQQGHMEGKKVQRIPTRPSARKGLAAHIYTYTHPFRERERGQPVALKILVYSVYTSVHYTRTHDRNAQSAGTKSTNCSTSLAGQHAPGEPACL